MGNIKLFEDKKVRSKWEEKEEKWYFSVQDVVEILIDTVDVKDYIKKMKKRDAQLNTNWGQFVPWLKWKRLTAGSEKYKRLILNNFCASFNLSHHPKQSRLNFGWHKLALNAWKKLKTPNWQPN